jgi:hypothetical protein
MNFSGVLMSGRYLRLANSPPSVSRWSRRCGVLIVSQSYRIPRPVTGIAFTTQWRELVTKRLLNQRQRITESEDELAVHIQEAWLTYAPVSMPTPTPTPTPLAGTLPKSCEENKRHSRPQWLRVADMRLWRPEDGAVHRQHRRHGPIMDIFYTSLYGTRQFCCKIDTDSVFCAVRDPYLW